MQRFDDPEYLKAYIQSHPNQKMAWYLLGKEYAAKGEAGKAAYCYAQAGEVYEAFENEPLPPEVLQAAKAEFERRTRQSDADAASAAIGADRKEKPAPNRRRWRLALLALTLAGFAIAFAPDSAEAPAAGTGPGHSAESGLARGEERHIWHWVDPRRSSAYLGGMVGQWTEQLPDKRLTLTLLELAEAERWLRWDSPPKPLLSLTGGAGEPSWTANWHDASRCDCEPAPFEAPASVGLWQDRLEQEAVLRTAVRYYAEAHGSPPESPEQLARSYPNNAISGITPLMRKLFPSVAESYGQPSRGGFGTGKADGREKSGETAAGGERLPDTLAIVVDRANYRLALVSGPVILRSYPVGLGGERTPEGTFPITEKVKNPNGTDKGAFGSRGMTLGDTLYAIHGTNEPDSIGKDESLGCIRMRREDIEELFALVPLGTPVTIGRGLLPDELVRRTPGYAIPSSAEEENPGKIYKWLS
ncbi:L,D-transpeptidase [Paenibacillus thermoaerophilus]|uniref:L,D-transpeptidase n=1 Tax=Paenibacillus thermoaerophilus TaxID=1215385 RepID=A0ABW2V8Z4_9BACL|nr:L,D-transpeptidase [Paenibacillus thermoaerophilus]